MSVLNASGSVTCGTVRFVVLALFSLRPFRVESFRSCFYRGFSFSLLLLLLKADVVDEVSDLSILFLGRVFVSIALYGCNFGINQVCHSTGTSSFLEEKETQRAVHPRLRNQSHLHHTPSQQRYEHNVEFTLSADETMRRFKFAQFAAPTDTDECVKSIMTGMDRIVSYRIEPTLSLSNQLFRFLHHTTNRVQVNSTTNSQHQHNQTALSASLHE